MLANSSNVNSFWGFLIIEEIIRNGYTYFILSPGSRCTPLTVAVARHPKAAKKLCYDERGAAFQAIGYAKATGNPAILICTSGSAAANYYPAVIEASINHLPLIILSADRPPELQQTGANQTIQQDNLYGKYVKWSFNLPCPDEKILPQMVLTTLDQACYLAPGIVHLNCPFREPLAPSDQEINPNYFQTIEYWLNSDQPYSEYQKSYSRISHNSLSRIIKIIQDTQQGILVTGCLSSLEEQNAVIKLAQKLNWPVFADIQSGLRLQASIPQIIPYFDQLLLQENFSQKYPIDTVLQIGDRITSKRFNQWLIQSKIKHHIVVTSYPDRHDPEHTVSLKIESDIREFSQEIYHHLPTTSKRLYLKELREQSDKIDQIIENYLRKNNNLNEPIIARLVSRYLPDKHGLFLASSMPIRDMDMYGVFNRHNNRIAANRGASGIEGTIASAVGFSVGLKAPVTVVVGDLAFLHDLNSLSQLKSLEYPLIIVLINNNGGGIFSFLPIAEFPDVFEPYFGTPHDLHFKSMAELFNVNYHHPQTLEDFIHCYQVAVNHDRSSLIEIFTKRTENYQLHQSLQTIIKLHLSTPIHE